jgi:hypothetical protein
MANQTVTTQLITIHGRGSITLYWRPQNALEERIDVSDRIMFLEVDGASIREQFTKDPNDPLGLKVLVPRTLVEALNTTPTKLAFVDETNIAEDAPVVVFEAKMARYGFIKKPDQTDDQ